MGVQFAGNILVQSNGGPLPIANGGTGQTSASAAFNALAPSQIGNSGKVLTTNGTTTSWANISGTPGGSDTAIQYNDAGTFGGNSFLTINKSTGAITSTSTLTNQGLLISKAAATLRQIDFQTSGSDRWFLQANSTAESGANAGSNFELVRIADNGTTQNVVYTVSRATGVVDFAVAPTVAGSPIAGASVAGSNTQIQYNNSGAFGASAQFTWDDSARVLTLGSQTSANSTTITGRTGSSAAAALTLSGGMGTGTQSGGTLTLQAGYSQSEGGGGSNPGPSLVLKGGSGGGTSPTGGIISFFTTPDFIANQTERLRINYNGAWGLAGANYGTSGQVLTSNGSGSAPTWQTVSSGSVSANSLTGTTLASNVVISSLQTLGTLSALAVTGTTTQTGAFNLAGASSPLQVGGSAGTSGQVLTSAGTGATPTWASPSVTALNGTGTYAASPQNTTGLYAGVTGSLPRVYFTNTAAATGKRNSQVYTNGTNLIWTFINDANSAETAWLTVSLPTNNSSQVSPGLGLNVANVNFGDGTTQSGSTPAVSAWLSTPNIASAATNTMLLMPGQNTTTTGAAATNTVAGALRNNSGQAGQLNLLGGANTSTGNAGNVTIQGGDASGAGTGGTVTINGGTTQGAAAAGNIVLNGGQSVSGSGGYISFSTTPTVTPVERFRILNNGAWSVGSAGTDVGTSGQVLTSNGNAAPTWQTVSVSTLANTTTLGTTTNSALLIKGVDGSTSGGASPMTIRAGNNTSTGNDITVRSGPSTGGSPSGAVLIHADSSGVAGATGGAVTIRGGDHGAAPTTGGPGGALTLRGGNTFSNGAAGGAVTISGGNSSNSSTSGAGGTVTISGGTAATGTQGGPIILQTGNTSLTERLRILSNGAWSVGTGGAATGTSGQVLTSNGSGSAPTWQNAAASSLTSTQVGYGSGSNLLTGTANFTFDATNAGLFVGSTTTASNRGIVSQQSDATIAAAQFAARKSRGTIASPTTVVSGDYTMVVSAQNYTSTGGFIRNGSFGFRTTGTIGASSAVGEWFWAASTTDDPDPVGNGNLRLRIDTAGNVVIGKPSLATTATDGFTYIPTTSGTPTGVPTTYTGFAPMQVDTSANKLWIYVGGTWKSVTLT